MGVRSATNSLSPLLRLAAAAQGLEAVGLLVVIAVNLADLAGGRTHSTSNAVAFIAVELIVAVGVAWVAYGIAATRPWSRTPAVMTQAFTAIIGVVLIQAHRYAWGLPALALAIAGLVGLLAPASFKALNRPQ